MNKNRHDPGPDHPERDAALRLDVPARLAAIDQAVERARLHLQERAPGSDLFPALTALREALLNAVVHGCGQDPALTVELRVAVEGDEAVLRVRDPGPGFDWRACPPAMPPAVSTCGRGRYIMNLYSRAVRYNEAGNDLTLRLALARAHDGKENSMAATVRPETDLVASQAEAFKGLLKEALRETPGGITVDMSRVASVDSVGLGVLIAAHNSLAKQGGVLELTNVAGDILKLLRAMRLDRHFHVNA